ncbi:mitochondrial import inner membrane translocase subunit Tim10-B-like [Argonauta hians]
MALNEAQMKLVVDLEMEMMADMYNRMTSACQKKCIPPRYKDAELNKGEAVCLDRCVAKYLDVHDRIGKKLTAISQQDEAAMKKLQSQIQTQQPT